MNYSVLVKLSAISVAVLLSLLVIVFSLAYRVDFVAFATHLLNDMEDSCIYSSDFYIVSFAAYYDPAQQASHTDYLQRFCQVIPDTGPLIVVIDFMDEDVRAMPVKVKFVKLKERSSLSGKYDSIIHETNYAKPATGFVKNKMRFSNAGDYAAYVEIGEKESLDHDVLVIPFRINSS